MGIRERAMPASSFCFTGFCVALSALVTAPAAANTLKVGPGQQYATVAAAVAASHDGDTIEVAAGNYDNDYAEITKKIALKAVGGFANMRATGLIPNRKGILITDADVTITGFSFTGAKVSGGDGGNGAGIRYQAGNLIVDGCYFTDNQDGILGVGDGTGSVTVNKSEFYLNGAPAGPSAGFTHNLYISAVARLEVTGSYFHGARVGHEFKSRATRTIINGSRFVNGPTGTASYSIDLPNGGDVSIANSQIEQGPMSQNPNIIGFGEEGSIHPSSKLVIEGSLIENDLKSPSAAAIWNASGTPVQIANTKVFGLTLNSLFHGPATLNGVDYLAIEPPISTKPPWE
jgi:hypothetical protein